MTRLSKGELEASLKRQKRLGQYFTGIQLASLLATLADCRHVHSAIDPMVGTGDMLMALVQTGTKLCRVGGVEVDPTAFITCLEQVKTWRPQPAQRELYNASVFDVDVIEKLGLETWDLVITNPPYVRYQLTSKGGEHDVKAPTADVVRTGLVQSLTAGAGKSHYLSELLKLTRAYSGLADLAVPSWILCAALVREGGTLAMVVPDTWMSRDYAKPIRKLLHDHFDMDFIVEDVDAAWFDTALVRTTLVVARRRPAIAQAVLRPGHIHVRLTRAASDQRSLVGQLFPDSHQPEADFARVAQGQLEQRMSLTLPGCTFEWVNEDSASGSSYKRRDDEKETGAVALIPPRLRAALDGETLTVASLDDVGWRVGQGLRTGANTFFYADLVTQTSQSTTVRPDPRLWEGYIHLPNDALRRVIRRQDDVGTKAHVTPDHITGVVLCLQDYILERDSAWIPPTLGQNEYRKLRVIPPELADYIQRVETINLGTDAEPRFIPQLSAVVTNARNFDARRPHVPARFWYQLPTFAPRHEPELFVARVNYRHPKTFLNVRRTLLIDANFSTLWTKQNDTLPAPAVLALMRSTWALAVMETSGTVMGGGALKLEATQLRRLPVPADIRKHERVLAKLGESLDDEPSTSWQRRVDDEVAQALGVRATTVFTDRLRLLLNEMLASRSR
jgi:hypothetical protein